VRLVGFRLDYTFIESTARHLGRLIKEVLFLALGLAACTLHDYRTLECTKRVHALPGLLFRAAPLLQPPRPDDGLPGLASSKRTSSSTSRAFQTVMAIIETRRNNDSSLR
jgi:hypothetical protein